MSSNQARATLYHNEVSICSIMVRYSLALRGPARSKEYDMVFDEKRVDLFKYEQMSEHFLCDVNAAGEVPALVSPFRNEPIPDSVDITLYLAQFYPNMVPVLHENKTKRLLADLHSISYFALTFAGKPEAPRSAAKYLREKLEGDISERYREALKIKLLRVEGIKVAEIDPTYLEKTIEHTKKFTKEVQTILEASTTGWCFGVEHPSALDAHIITFIARLFDIGRQELVPEPVQKYALKAMEGDEWKSVMQGRTTSPFA